MIRRIGELYVGAPEAHDDLSKQAAPLRELGWVEGQNLHIERRYASSIDELEPLAKGLVRANVELIIANGPNPTLATMRATATTPIVFRVASDPVLSGLVKSLAQPGGNVTGFSVATPEVEAKLLSLLKELLPTVRRVGMMETSGNPQFRLLREQFERSCRLLRLEPVFVEISVASQIDDAIARLEKQRAQAIVLRDDSFSDAHASDIISAALKRGLPTMTVVPEFVQAGALASYSTTQAEAYRRTAYYVDRILRGSKPADLPVEQATQFELVINLKTAGALGLTVPQSVLLRADSVIR